jgi:hypothetical protein
MRGNKIRRRPVGQNSHRSDINESLKPWSLKVTVEKYDFAVLTKKQFVKKYGQEKYDSLARQ